jgi:hypothetical protein
MMNRRGLITGLVSLIAAPAIVRASNLMPVKSMLDPYPNFYFYLTAETDHCTSLVGARASAYIKTVGQPWRLITAPVKEIRPGVYGAHLLDSDLCKDAVLRFSAVGADPVDVALWSPEAEFKSPLLWESLNVPSNP